MRVIVMVTDNDLTAPMVFMSVEAVEKYIRELGNEDESSTDYQLMMAALKEGKDFSDAYSYIGWKDVII